MSLQDRTRAEIVTAYRTLEAENAVKSLEIADLRRQLAEAQQAAIEVAKDRAEIKTQLGEAQQARERAETTVYRLQNAIAERDAANALLRRAEPYCKTASGHPYDEGLSAAITAHLKP